MVDDDMIAPGRSFVARFVRSALTLNGDPERVIGMGRLLISVFALGAIYVDPTQPANLVNDAYRGLSCYVAIAALLLFVPARTTRRGTYKLAVMALDISVGGLLVYITDELASPFLTFFTFMIISAAIRWEWLGTLVTAATLQVILIAIGLPDLEDGESELNLLIIRSIFCWVIVLLLGYFGSYRDRSNKRLRELASWPHDVVRDEDHPWLAASLRHASMVLGADTIAVLWRDRDKTLQHTAIWRDGSCRFVDLQDHGNEPPLPTMSQMTVEVGTSARQLPSGLAELLDASDEALRQAYMCGFATIRFLGCAIVVEPGFRDRDTLLLTRIVASRIAMELEQFSLVRDYASAAGLRERARIAHDLHDSILQDLTAAVLQIDSTRRASPGHAPDLLRIQETLQSSQTKIRNLVEGTRISAGDSRKLADLLQHFVEPLGAQWGCNVMLHVDPPTLETSECVATELCLTLSEATANAARHGGARNLRIDVSRQQDRLDVTIEDDGVCGRADIPHPASINTRIKALGGTLDVGRHLAGLTLRIAIPLDQPAS